MITTSIQSWAVAFAMAAPQPLARSNEAAAPPSITEIKLTIAGLSADSTFGHSVDLQEGELALGSPRFETSVSGEVYVFARDGSYAVVHPSQVDPGFGQDVAIDGDYLAVAGIRGVYVYDRTASGWVEHALLPPSVADLDMAHGRLFVGRPGVGGRVSVFVLDPIDPTHWILEASLKPDDAGEDEGIGSSVACGRNTLVVGAPGQGPSGAAYVFELNALNVWEQSAKLVEPISPDASFGYEVALHDGTIAVSAPRNGNQEIGAVFLYRRLGDSQSWTLEDRVDPRPGQKGEFFGWGLSIDEDGLFVGASGKTLQGQLGAGVVYQFRRTASTPHEWQFARRIHASDSGDVASFGFSLKFLGKFGAVSAFVPNGSGAVYLYQLPN